MSCSLSQRGVWTVISQGALQPCAFTPSGLNGCSRLSSGHSALPRQLCCVRLVLTGNTGASPGGRPLKANKILHFKWQSRMTSCPCQNSLTLILLTLHAGELDWAMDDGWRMLLSLVKRLGCMLLFSSLVRGSRVKYCCSPRRDMGQTWWICLLD